MAQKRRRRVRQPIIERSRAPDGNGSADDGTRRGRRIVVGIGASAGGLQALLAFFANVPRGTGLPFVVVQHLAPGRRSLLPDLLKEKTDLQVVEAADGQAPAPDTVHVAPPACGLTLEEGRLRVRSNPRARGGGTQTIDLFLRSLADECGEAAIGVLLSGSGADGALGLKRIKERGGFCCVQERSTAAHERMPLSAVELGVVDSALPPRELAAEVVGYARRLGAQEAQRGEQESQLLEHLDQITAILRRRTNHDFRHYKQSTLVRRIRRRIQILHLDGPAPYVERLSHDHEEADALFRDLLIGVTEFFRDAEAFEALDRQVVRTLLSEETEGPVRVWVPGCATGEEAYSVAILLRRRLEELKARPQVQVFATDIDEHALKVARAGAYPQGIAEQVPPDCLRYFTRQGDAYVVNAEVRELCLFSLHDLIHDPPFSKLHLISCRNVLIYFGPHLQKKLFPVFHYALKPGGFLFLGPSESVTAHQELFRPVDARHRISQRKETPLRSPLDFAAGGLRRGLARVDPPALPPPDLDAMLQRVFLDEFAPSAAVVNGNGDVVHVHGRMGDYLEVPPGTPTNNLVHMARRGLRLDLRSALQKAVRARRKVVQPDVVVSRDGTDIRLNLVVQPMPDFGADDGLYLVAFQETARTDSVEGGERGTEEADPVLLQLERDLQSTRAHLQTTIEELETSNEELKSSNEELLSMNEELQSANEELETSKEEVQSVNEALARANNDLENLLQSTRIATLFLDEEGRIRSFTPAARELYNLRDGDAGRPLAHLTPKTDPMPPLPAPADVEAAGGLVEHEVGARDGRWFLRRVLPYRSESGEVEGLVVTFLDVTELKRAQRRLTAEHAVVSVLAGAKSLAEAAPEVMRALQSLLDADAYELWLSSGDSMNRVEGDAGTADGSALAAAADDRGEVVWAEDLPGGRHASGLALPLLVQDGCAGAMVFFFRRRTLRDEHVVETVRAIGGNLGQFLARTGAEQALQSFFASVPLLMGVVELDGGDILHVDDNPAACRFYGLPEGGTRARRESELGTPPGVLTRWLDAYREARETGRPVAFQYEHDARWLSCTVSYVGRGPAGRSRFSYVAQDVTERTRAERQLRRSEQRLRLALEAGRMGTWEWDAATGAVSWSASLERIHGLEPGGFGGTFSDFQREIDPEHRARVMEAIRAAMEDGTDYHVEYPILRPDGSRRWLETRGSVQTAGDGRPSGMIGVCCDVTERREAEEALQRRLRQLETIYRLSDAVAHAADIEQITETALDGLLDAVRADRASVLLFDADGVMRFKGWRGLSEDYRRAVEGHSPWTPEDAAARPIAIEDAETDESLAPYRGTILVEGIRALAFIPLVSGARVLGKFMVYHDRPHAFTEEELRVCQTIAGHVAYAIEQTRSARAVSDSERRYRQVVQAVPAAVYTTDAQGRVTLCNDAAVDLWGREPKLGEDTWCGSWRIYDADGSPMPLDECPMARTLREGRSVRHEVVIERPDGTRRNVLPYPEPLFDADGKLVGAINMLVDITARKQAEQALRESEERFRELAETVQDVFYIATPDGLQYVSPAFRSVWGLHPAEACGKPDRLLETVVPEDRARVRTAMARRWEGERTVLEYRIRRPDGEVRWIHDRSYPVMDGDGAVVRVVGDARDVTERRRAEESNALLAAAGRELTASLNCEEALANVARAAVPGVADWVAVHLLGEDGAIEQLVVHHCDPARLELARRLHERYPPLREAAYGVAKVMRTGEPEFVTRMDDEMLARRARDEEHLAMLRELGVRSYMCLPLRAKERVLGVMTFVSAESGRRYDAADLAVGLELARRAGQAVENARLYESVRQHARSLEIVNRVNLSLAGELDLEKLVQAVTDAGRELSGAQFGAFFYNVADERGGHYMLYTLSGADRSEFERFGMPRATPVFEPTFRGAGVVRSDDITKDPRYGKLAPHRGMPEGHLPVRSYLAVPVVSGSGTVIGGLFFGHEKQGVFTAESERIVQGIAAQAAVAIDNARAYSDRARLAAIVESTQDVVIGKTIEGRITTWNAAAERVYGYTAAEAIGRNISLIVPEDRRAELDGIMARLRAGESIPAFETVRRRKDGALLPVLVTISPLRDRAGRVVAAAAVARDITEQKRHEEHQQLLLKELQHRVKNTMATVLSIAGQTRRRSSTLDEFFEAYEGRLLALAKVHGLLAQTKWQETDLASLVHASVQAYHSRESQSVTVEGPPLTLRPKEALALCMILHELTTNAVKYGALSAPEGRVRVSWADEDGRLHLRWVESGGPPVEPPQRRGFGTQMVERGTRYELGGRASFEFDPAGVRCSVVVPRPGQETA